MKKILALLLVLVMVFSFAACGKEAAPILVAEKESAGESVATTEEDFKDYEYTAVDTQAKALMEVSAGTADAAVVDYVMSIGSIGEGTDYEDLTVEGDGYADEEYGIAFRKGSDLTAKVNEIIRELHRLQASLQILQRNISSTASLRALLSLIPSSRLRPILTINM